MRLGAAARRRPLLLPFAALAAGVLAISWSAIFVRWTHMPGIASAFYRLLIATGVLGLLCALRRSSRSKRPRSQWLWLAALGGVFFAGDVGLYNVAVLQTTAGGATFLGNNAPLVVGLLTWLLTRRLPSPRFWVALGIGTGGALLIFFVDHGDALTRSRGDLLAVLASFCFAFYLLTTERLREQLDTLTVVAVSTAASAAVLLLVALATHTALRVPAGPSLASLLGLGLLCQLTGYFCLTYALGHLPATVSAVVMLAVAPLTAVWAVACFRERLTALQWLGGGAILVAIWVVSGSSREPDVRLAEPEFL